jgi:hypothetical protein
MEYIELFKQWNDQPGKSERVLAECLKAVQENDFGHIPLRDAVELVVLLAHDVKLQSIKYRRCHEALEEIHPRSTSDGELVE